MLHCQLVSAAKRAVCQLFWVQSQLCGQPRKKISALRDIIMRTAVIFMVCFQPIRLSIFGNYFSAHGLHFLALNFGPFFNVTEAERESGGRIYSAKDHYKSDYMRHTMEEGTV